MFRKKTIRLKLHRLISCSVCLIGLMFEQFILNVKRSQFQVTLRNRINTWLQPLYIYIYVSDVICMLNIRKYFLQEIN